MRKVFEVALLAVILLLAGEAFADQYDTQWIAQCMEDNKIEGVSTDVVIKYCKCMNDKMSSDETLSITEWEKANPKAREDCSRKAGWK